MLENSISLSDFATPDNLIMGLMGRHKTPPPLWHVVEVTMEYALQQLQASNLSKIP